MVDSAQCDLPLADKLSKLREHRKRSRGLPALMTSDIWSSTSLQIQLMVCDGALVHCARKPDRYEIDIRPADGSHPRHLVIQSENFIHLEAADFSQELLVASERVQGSQ